MGTPEFAVPSLEVLINQSFEICGVVTAPDKPRGRGQEMLPTAVKDSALRHHLNLLQPVSLKDPLFAEQIKTCRPDLIVVVAFRILPREVFTIPRLGSINLHASLLPKYRGAAPINWAIMKGEKETGVTTFFLAERVDTGRLLQQASMPIGPDDDAGIIHDRLATLGADLLLSTVRSIEAGDVHPLPQDDTLASPAPKIFKEDCRIRWDAPAETAHNLIRGLSPRPGAFTSHRGKTLKIYRSQILDTPSSGAPGTAEASGTGLKVHTRDRLIAILEIQQEGKSRMGIEEFLRGYRFAAGEKLT